MSSRYQGAHTADSHGETEHPAPDNDALNAEIWLHLPTDVPFLPVPEPQTPARATSSPPRTPSHRCTCTNTTPYLVCEDDISPRRSQEAAGIPDSCRECAA